MWTILKYIIFYNFMFGIFGHKACGILAPQPGIKSTLPALEGKLLTTGRPKKAQLNAKWF